MYTKVSTDRIKGWLELDEIQRQLMQKLQKIQEERNRLSKEEGIKRGKELKIEISKIKAEIEKIEPELNDLLLSIPCLPDNDVTVGPGESANKVIKTVGEIPQFDFTVKDHLQLGEELDLIDTKTASEVSGSRFGYLKNSKLSSIVLFSLSKSRIKIRATANYLASTNLLDYAKYGRTVASE